MKCDAAAVADVMELMETIINPFDNEYQALVNVCNGSVAPPEVSSDMRTMLERGEAAALSFMESNVLSAEPDIYTTIKKNNLQTSSSINRKVTGKSKNGNVVALKNSKKLLAKMLLIAKSRDLDMEDVLKYSLRPFPAPLATMEGNLVKTCKSKLLSIIEAESKEAYVENVDGDSAIPLIIDAMAVLQTMKLTATTFGKLAEGLLAKIIMMANSSNSSRVDFVGDSYPQQSIKDLEREKRSDGETYLTKIYGTQQRVPRQWKKFLSAGRNKEELLKFLFEEWKRCCPQVLNGVEVLITHENECHRLYAMGNNTICSIVNSLTCNHEEADTRMICHAMLRTLR